MMNAHTRTPGVPKRYEYLCSPSESHAGRSYSDADLKSAGHNPRCLVLLSLNHIFQSYKSCKIPLKIAELSIMQLVNQRCCSCFAAAVFSDDYIYFPGSFTITVLHILAMKKQDYICVLFQRTRFAQIARFRFRIITFRFTVKLSHRNNRDASAFSKQFQSA